MAFLNLSSYKSLENGLFVKVEVDQYRTTAGATPGPAVLTFSDYTRSVTIGSDTYVAIGNMLGITSSTSELKATNSDLTITVSGVPNNSLRELIYSRLKGSRVTVYRGFFDAATGAVLTGDITNPVGRFRGFITNISVNEEYDLDAKTATNTISLMCSSILDVLANTGSGRRTNPEDQKELYPSDISMDRVPNLIGANLCNSRQVKNSQFYYFVANANDTVPSRFYAVNTGNLVYDFQH
jgi:hypothetical protein